MYYIFSWKIKPTNSMQSIACIMVIYARLLLSVSSNARGKRQSGAYIGLVGFNTHTFLLPIFVIRKKGLRSTSGLNACVKIALFSSYFSLFDPRCSDYYTFVLPGSYYTIHINNSNGFAWALIDKQRPFLC